MEASDTRMKPMKKMIENFFIHLLARAENPGALWFTYIPNARGSPSIRKMVTSISAGLIVNDSNKPLVGPYKELQNKVLRGVITIASSVEIADMLIERGVLPFARYVRKFETFPPGQEATRNNPRAMLGRGWTIKTSR